VLREPIPQQLLDLTRGSGAGIVSLAERRERRWPRFGPAQWGALAATLAIGVFAGTSLDQARGGPIARAGDRLVARGELARVLDQRLASTDQATPLRVGLSFRSREGVYCRTFEGAERMAGVACKEGGAWAVRMAVRQEPAAAGPAYEMAASGAPPAVLTVVEALIQGDPLDAEQEAHAKAGKWESASR
jgi:hypothetical protein